MTTTSPMQEEPLPYNIQAEQAVIASVMIEPAYLDAIPYLKPEHFYRLQHQTIYATLEVMHKQGLHLDPVLLQDALETNLARLDTRDALKDAGGFAYLTQVLLTVPSATHCESYAKKVYEKGELRNGIENSEKAIKKAFQTGNVIDFRQHLQAAADSVHPIVDRDALDNEELGRRILAQLKHTHDTGEAPLLPLGLSELAEHMNGWERTKITVLGALSSVGKTSYAIAEAVHLAEQGYHVAYVSIEIDATALASRFISHIGQIDETQLIRGFLPHDVPPVGKDAKYPYRRWNRESVEGDTAKAAAALVALPISLIARDYEGDTPAEPDFSPDGIVAALRKLHTKKPIDYFVIDHLFILEFANGTDAFKSSIEYGEALMKFRKFAEWSRAHGLALHQLDPVKALGMEIPNASCFPGSQRIWQNSDNLLALFAPHMHNKGGKHEKWERAYNLIKVRRGNAGEVIYGVRFDGAVSRFKGQAPAAAIHQNGTRSLADRFGSPSPTAADSDNILF